MRAVATAPQPLQSGMNAFLKGLDLGGGDQRKIEELLDGGDRAAAEEILRLKRLVAETEKRLGDESAKAAAARCRCCNRLWRWEGVDDRD